MNDKSIADELVDYSILKQRLIDGMSGGDAPNQEMEMYISDEIIRQAIINAKAVLIKINCVNREAYKAGIEKQS